MRYVRFGSKADMCGAIRHVRFTPNSDRESGCPPRGPRFRGFGSGLGNASANFWIEIAGSPPEGNLGGSLFRAMPQRRSGCLSTFGACQRLALRLPDSTSRTLTASRRYLNGPRGLLNGFSSTGSKGQATGQQLGPSLLRRSREAPTHGPACRILNCLPYPPHWRNRVSHVDCAMNWGDRDSPSNAAYPRNPD
jgi:hypothetical protein